MSPRVLSQKELVFALKDAHGNEGIKFCFLLGAGASVSSGIPLGGKLAGDWCKEIKERKGDKEFAAWMEEKSIDENDLASSYPVIYEERFSANRENGYAEIQKIFSGKEPNVGYAYFAKMLAENGNKFVITTNFDTLIEDALFEHTKTRPLVCGHESLASYINLHTDRPTIIKVHRDILLNPISDVTGVANMDKAWEKALRPVLSGSHLIALGYNGNDGSLMGYLKTLKDSRKPIYWCVRNKAKISEKIKEVLTKDDYIVEIEGFDEFVIELCRELGVKIDIDEEKLENSEIVKNAMRRAKKFIEQLNELGKRESKKEAGVSEAVQEILPKWWEYESRASRAKTPDEKEVIYKEGIKQLSKSHELMNNYANFLKNIRKDYDNAEKYYKKALELDPDDADYNGNYALFLKNIRKDYDNAEKYYKKALELDPEHANNNGNYALFLSDIRKDYDNAEKYYKKALELDPEHANNNGNYALFLSDIRKDYDNAETYYKKRLS